MQNNLSIGEASKISQVKIPTIRYYEQIGLLLEAPRTEGNRRLYDHSDIQRLKFIRHARDLGFDIEAIRTLLKLQDEPAGSCDIADEIARDRLEDVERRINSLVALRSELKKMLDSHCHGRINECRVIEVLSNHLECEDHI